MNINTKDGKAVIISEEDENGLVETVDLSSIKSVREGIVEGLNTPVSQCIPEEKVDW